VHDRNMAFVIAFLAIGFVIAIGFWPADRTEPGELPTAGFRRHHDELKRVIHRWTEQVDDLHDASPARQIEIMEFSMGFLKQHVMIHAGVEERVLYPAVERAAGAALTAPFREEHRILERRVRELEAVSEPAAFCHKSHQLAGLLTAHFEVEERVLLEVLDRRMTPDRFQREVWSRMVSELD